MRSSTRKIIHIGLQNLGLNKKESLSPEEVKLLENELEDSVIPPIDLESFFEGGDALEAMPDPDHSIVKSLFRSLFGIAEPAETAAERANKDTLIARNLLRHLLRGSLASKPGQSLLESPLLRFELIEALFVKRRKEIFDATRVELQKIVLNNFKKLTAPSLDQKKEKRHETFLSMVLGIYPFIDPADNEDVQLPQKINGQWHLIDYQFERLDVSPKTGPLASVLEDEDRMYAFALNAKNGAPANTKNILIHMGTTYPAGQGSELANLYNVCPNHSVGEAHDMTEVDAWFAKQAAKSVLVTGHSKGATDALITAAKYPDKVQQVDCLNPAPLARSTLKRLKPAWNALSPAQRPVKNVYKQKGDPVAYIGKGYLEGTNIYRVVPDAENPTMKVPVLKTYFAHAGHYSGQENVAFVKAKTDRINRSRLREFVNDVKSALDWVLFPFGYAKYFAQLVMRKMARFYEEHKAAIRVCIIAAALLTGIGLIVAGVFIPPLLVLGKWILVQVGIALAPAVLNAAVAVGAMIVLIGGSIAAPFILELATKITTAVVGLALAIAHMAVVAAVGLTASAISGLKIGLKTLFGSYKEELPANPSVPASSKKPTSAKSGTKVMTENTPLINEEDLDEAVEMVAVNSTKVKDLPQALSKLSVLAHFSRDKTKSLENEQSAKLTSAARIKK